MTCEAQRQFDEMFCARCNLRWCRSEDSVRCGKTLEPEPNERDISRLRIAKALNGPLSDAHIGRETMLKIRDHLWSNQTSPSERQQFLAMAEAVLVERDHD